MTEPTAQPDATPKNGALSSAGFILLCCVGILVLWAVGVYVLHMPASRAGDIGLSWPRAAFLSAGCVSGVLLRTTVSIPELTSFGQSVCLVLMTAGTLIAWAAGGVGMGSLLGRGVRVTTSVLVSAGCYLALMLIHFYLAPAEFSVLQKMLSAAAFTGAVPQPFAIEQTGQSYAGGIFYWQIVQPTLGLVCLMGPVTLVVILRRLFVRPMDEREMKEVTSGWTIPACWGLSFLLCTGMAMAESVGQEGFASGGSVVFRSFLADAVAMLGGSVSQSAPVLAVADQPRAVGFLYLLVLAAGLGPGGAAGGIGFLPVYLFLTWMWRRSEVLSKAMAFFAGWAMVWVMLAIVFIALLLELLPQMPAERVQMLAVSLLAGHGMTHDSVPISGMAGYALAGGTLAGKLAGLVMLAVACKCRIRL